MRQFRTSTDSVFDLDTVLERTGDVSVVAQAGPPAQEVTGPQPDRAKAEDA